MFGMFCFQTVREEAADPEVTHISQAATCQTLSLSEWPGIPNRIEKQFRKRPLFGVTVHKANSFHPRQRVLLTLGQRLPSPPFSRHEAWVGGRGW